VAKGSFLFTAGQVAINPATGQIVEGDVKTQTRQVMNNLRAVLMEAGSSMERVVKTTVYLKDMNEFAMMNEVYGEFFPANPPARSTVEVARLPKDARVEIDVVALVEPA
jgi:2-iminobutanoate/2-iminopropanoate deaminase